MCRDIRIGIEVDDTLVVDGFGRGKQEQRQVCYPDAGVWDNKTVDFHDGNSGDDDDDGDIRNDACVNTNGMNADVLKVGIGEGEK